MSHVLDRCSLVFRVWLSGSQMFLGDSEQRSSSDGPCGVLKGGKAVGTRKRESAYKSANTSGCS